MNAYPQLVMELDELRRQWRMRKLLEGCLLVAAGVLAVLTLLVAADNLLKLGVAGRFLLACILWSGLAAGVFSLVIKRWLEDRRDDFFAALVEQWRPDLHNRLINALQLGRGHNYGSPRIIEAIVSDAASATIDLDLSDCLDWQPVKRASISTGIAMLLIIGYATFFSPRFFNGLGRVMLPIADIEPYTATDIDDDSITPKSGKRFPAGAAINITVRIGGSSIPGTATLYRSSDGQQWRPAPMRPDRQKTRTEKHRTFRFNIPEAEESFQFYITAGDDRSRTSAIEIVQRPQVESLSVTYEFPEYTGRGAEATQQRLALRRPAAGDRVEPRRDLAALLGVLGPGDGTPDVRGEGAEADDIVGIDRSLHLLVGTDTLVVELDRDSLALQHGTHVADAQDHGERILLDVGFDVGQ